tara:strand:+ start:662 stop:973 length:312 start_codon:yes stop_codon:yes gene_type:complete
MADMYKVLDGVRVKMTPKEISEKKTLDQANKKNSLSDFDYAIRDLRTQRNFLISSTDYLALSDNKMSESMKTYRQKLRDITEGVTTVEQIKKIKFPKIPTEKK